MGRLTCGLALLLFLMPGTARAQDTEAQTAAETVDVDANARLLKEMAELRALIEAQNQKIERQATALDEQSRRLEEMEDRGHAMPPLFEMVRSEKASPWLPSMRGKKWELGGELEVEYRSSEEDRDPAVVAGGNTYFNDTSSSGSTFDMDWVALHLKTQWNDVLSTYFGFEFFENSAHVDTAYAQLDLVNSDDNGFFVRAGLDHNFNYFSRSTEIYAMSGGMFWRDEFSQLRLHGEHAFGSDSKWLYWDAMVGNTLPARASSSAFNENPAGVNNLLQNDLPSSGAFDLDYDGHMQYGIGLGLRPNLKEFGKLDLSGWYITSELQDDAVGSDLDLIADAFFTPNGLPTRGHPTDGTATLTLPAAAGKDTDKRQVGGRLVYEKEFWEKKAQFKTVFEYISAEDGPLDRDVWYLESGIKFKLDGYALGKDEKWFTSVQPIVRYEELDIDDDFDNNFASPLTWDRQRWLIAFNVELCRNALLRFEYGINDEDIDHAGGGRLNNAPVGSVDNNEFLIQLELKF